MCALAARTQGGTQHRGRRSDMLASTCPHETGNARQANEDTHTARQRPCVKTTSAVHAAAAAAGSAAGKEGAPSTCGAASACAASRADPPTAALPACAMSPPPWPHPHRPSTRLHSAAAAGDGGHGQMRLHCAIVTRSRRSPPPSGKQAHSATTREAEWLLSASARWSRHGQPPARCTARAQCRRGGGRCHERGGARRAARLARGVDAQRNERPVGG